MMRFALTLVAATGFAILSTGITKANDKPAELSIAGGNAGSPMTVIGAGAAQIYAKHGVRANTEQGGGMANVVNVSNGTSQLGLIMANAVPDAAAGAKPFPSKITNIAAIANLTPFRTHVLVLADSGVNSFEDLKGKPFASQPVGNTTTAAFAMLLEAHGLTEDDLSISRGGQSFGADLVKNRKAVGFTATTGIPAAAFAEIAQTIDVKFLSVSDAALEKVRKQNAGFSRYVIPAGTYRGQDKEIQTMGTAMMMIARDDMPEGEAYWVTKTLVENLDDFRAVHGSIKELTAKFMATPPTPALHPGAAKYYKEIGALK